MEGENRLRGDPAARSRSEAQAEEAGRKRCLGGEKGQRPSAPSRPRPRPEGAYSRAKDRYEADAPTFGRLRGVQRIESAGLSERAYIGRKRPYAAERALDANRIAAK